MTTASRDRPRTPRLARRAVALAAPLAALVVACRAERDAVARQPVEVCDGVDNDGDGIADDLDADDDGVCDCLQIGVLGYPGSVRSSDLIQAWMHRRAVPTRILAGSVLTRELLAPLDVLVVQDVQDGVALGTAGREGNDLGIGRAFSDAEVEALKVWVDAGGGLMTLTAYTNDPGELTNVNRLLAPFGLSYASSPAIALRALLPITQWDTTHPIAAGVTQVAVNGAYPVLGAGTAVAWDPAPGAYDLGRALESGRGRVFAWGDEWIALDAEWTNPSFQAQRLWTNALAWLTPPGRCQLPLH